MTRSVTLLEAQAAPLDAPPDIFSSDMTIDEVVERASRQLESATETHLAFVGSWLVQTGWRFVLVILNLLRIIAIELGTVVFPYLSWASLWERLMRSYYHPGIWLIGMAVFLAPPIYLAYAIRPLTARLWAELKPDRSNVVDIANFHAPPSAPSIQVRLRALFKVRNFELSQGLFYYALFVLGGAVAITVFTFSSWGGGMRETLMAQPNVRAFNWVWTEFLYLVDLVQQLVHRMRRT